MTLDLEEHFWARPSSSKVGTELGNTVKIKLLTGALPVALIGMNI